ncbi:SMI1/KNR4 family protein [Persicirhabdus sediminis]|uniref:SMI1/KNR4 family protein n=1 Tax=Persicirhabdus sediminis TaxID=454144 RepID=A0A8J7MBW1_9BACT|nr:SMI1/KNR4 family protein [Persicirhabdus sediminis]
MEKYDDLDEEAQEVYPYRDFPSLDEAQLQAFEQSNGILLPPELREILLEGNGGYIKEEFLRCDDEDPDLLTGIQEVFGISNDPDHWMCSIVPLPKWVTFKHEIYTSFPTVSELESINGPISRYFVISGDGVVFHLLDYTASESSKAVCYLDLVGGDQKIIRLGDGIASVIQIER